jgi:hypothetical protein
MLLYFLSSQRLAGDFFALLQYFLGEGEGRRILWAKGVGLVEL